MSKNLNLNKLTINEIRRGEHARRIELYLHVRCTQRANIVLNVTCRETRTCAGDPNASGNCREMEGSSREEEGVSSRN